MRVFVLAQTLLMNASVKWMLVVLWLVLANVSSQKYPNTYDVTTGLLRQDPSIIKKILLSTLDLEDNNKRLLPGVRFLNPKDPSTEDKVSQMGQHVEDLRKRAESKRAPLFGCRNSYLRNNVLDDVRKRHSSRALREEMYKRSSLNQLIRRLMAMKGQSFSGGRALNIRFGVGGR